MGYRKKFEDSYLDDEVDEFEGNDTTDAERYLRLFLKEIKSGEDLDKLEKIKTRMYLQAKLPGIPGVTAKEGIIIVSRQMKEIGKNAEAIEWLTKLQDLATEIGDKELYYQSMDEMSE